MLRPFFSFFWWVHHVVSLCHTRNLFLIMNRDPWVQFPCLQIDTGSTRAKLSHLTPRTCKLIRMTGSKTECLSVFSGLCVLDTHHIMDMLGYQQVNPTPIDQDNNACIFLVNGSDMFNRRKHIDTRFYHIRELSESGEVKLYKVSGENQPADILPYTVTTSSIICEASKLTYGGMSICLDESLIGIYYLLSVFCTKKKHKKKDHVKIIEIKD